MKSRETWIPTKEWFAKQHDVKEAPSKSTHLCRLVGRRCYPEDRCSLWIRGIDHTTLWLRDRKAVCFTWEPYGLTQEQLRSALLFEQQHQLELSIDARSWHNPGATVLVELWKAGAYVFRSSKKVDNGSDGPSARTVQARGLDAQGLGRLDVVGR